MLTVLLATVASAGTTTFEDTALVDDLPRLTGCRCDATGPSPGLGRVLVGLLAARRRMPRRARPEGRIAA